MFTACELCVCATYSAVIGTSLTSTARTDTSAGGRGGGPWFCLEQAATKMSETAKTAIIGSLRGAGTKRSDFMRSSLWQYVRDPRTCTLAAPPDSAARANASTSLHGVEPRFEILRPRREHGLDLGARDRLPFDEFPFAYAGDHGLDQQLVRYAVLAFDLRRHACHLGRRACSRPNQVECRLDRHDVERREARALWCHAGEGESTRGAAGARLID